MSLLNAWRIIFAFDFVSFFSSSRRDVILLSSLIFLCLLFCSLLSLSLLPLLGRLRIRLLDIFVCCAAKCEKVAINFVSVAFNGPT